MHLQEEQLIKLRALRKTSEGRDALREHVHVEHVLDKPGSVQENRARSRGARKDELDLRRCAAIVNLQATARSREQLHVRRETTCSTL